MHLAPVSKRTNYYYPYYYLQMLPALVLAMSDLFTNAKIFARKLRNHNTSRCFTALTPLSKKRCQRASESCTYGRELSREASHDSVHCSERPRFAYPDPARARNQDSEPADLRAPLSVGLPTVAWHATLAEPCASFVQLFPVCSGEQGSPVTGQGR